MPALHLLTLRAQACLELLRKSSVEHTAAAQKAAKDLARRYEERVRDVKRLTAKMENLGQALASSAVFSRKLRAEVLSVFEFCSETGQNCGKT